MTEIEINFNAEPFEPNGLKDLATTNKDSQSFKNISPEDMKLVQVEYDKLREVIKQLDENVSNLLQAQENKFLVAYKNHARKITTDFTKLQAEIQGKEHAIQNHAYVKELEEERDWYKKEALHLDSMLTKSKSNEHSFREKVQQLEQDKEWLSNQLKELLKEKKELISKLESN